MNTLKQIIPELKRGRDTVPPTNRSPVRGEWPESLF